MKVRDTPTSIGYRIEEFVIPREGVERCPFEPRARYELPDEVIPREGVERFFFPGRLAHRVPESL